MAPPRYQQIAADLTRKISSGEIAVGSRLPTEHQLMAQYGASRNTVRSALGQLETQGLISRRRNRGTVVESQPGSAAFAQPLSSLEDLISFASSAVREVRGSGPVVMDTALARELACPAGSRWLWIGMTRARAGRRAPLNWTDAYVDPDYAGMADLAAEFPDRLLSDLIEARYGRQIVMVEQTVSSCLIEDETMRARLVLPKASHGLVTVRRYRDASKALVLVTRSVYPGERYSMTTTLVRRPT